MYQSSKLEKESHQRNGLYNVAMAREIN